jgi:predicted site-specific integrase-resolvase
MKQGSKHYINVHDAAMILGVSVQWVRQLIKAGQFKGVLRGVQRSYWIPEDEIRNSMNRIPGRERLVKEA